MSLSTSTLRRLGAILTLTAAVASIAAPTTLANHQDVGVKAALKEIRATVGTPDAIDRYLRNHPQATTNVKCDAVCRYLHNHERGIPLSNDTPGSYGGVPLPATVPTSHSSWPAALAAATASGALIVLTAGTLLVLRRRRSLAA